MRGELLLVLLLSACAPSLQPPCDQDQDGHASPECGGQDCDDLDPGVHPGALERCDDGDEDCDGSVDEDPVDGLTVFDDGDGDGLGDDASATVACEVGVGQSLEGGDCDDSDPEIRGPRSGYLDEDGDGFGAWNGVGPEEVCDPDVSLVDNRLDCDDTAADVHPGATEVCNEVDDNCDGQVDDADWYRDDDGDGYGLTLVHVTGCPQPEGWAPLDGDCDDADPDRSPGHPEVCGNGVDDDCRVDDLGACGMQGGVGAEHAAMEVGWSVSDWVALDEDGDGASELILTGPRTVQVPGGTLGPVDVEALPELLVEPGLAGWTPRVTLLDGLEPRLAWAGPTWDAGYAVHLFALPLAPDTPLEQAEATIALSFDSLTPRLAAGDVDGDGAADLLVGQPDWDGLRGRTLLFLGPLAGVLDADDADAVITGVASTVHSGLEEHPDVTFLYDHGDHLGLSLLFLGDLDGDGYGAFAVGAPGWNSSSLDEGGADTGAVFVFEGPLIGEHDGLSAAAVLRGEVGHGPWECDQGRDPAGGDDDDDVLDDDDVAWYELPCRWTNAASHTGAMLGAVDADQDGVIELVVASWSGDATEVGWIPRDLSLLGHEAPLLGEIQPWEADWELERATNQWVEWWHEIWEPEHALVSGDLDGDGLADLAIGLDEPGWPGVWVLYGPIPPGPTPFASLAGALVGVSYGQAGGRMGTADTTGDGVDDLVVGRFGAFGELLVYRGGPGP